MMRTIRIAAVMALFSAMALIGLAAPAGAGGAVQVSGVGVPFDTVTCAAYQADYVISLSGDLDGCVYGYVTDATVNENSGTYNEWADELFVGTWGDLEGTFEMTEHFTGKFRADLSQVFGRCQHPIKPGSGTGDFEGISGRLDFKDDVSTGTADYRGHLKP
jgi:hypothetical protein